MKGVEPLIIISYLFVLSLFFIHCGVDLSASVSQLIVNVGDSIQDAINQAVEGTAILIKKGRHVEESYPIIVNKTVVIVGEKVESTIVDGNGTERGIFLVRSDGVMIKNLTMRNTIEHGFVEVAGVHLFNVRNAEISNCKIENCMVGVLLKNSSESIISRNAFLNNRWAGIVIRDNSTSNLFVGNTISTNNIGLRVADRSCKGNRVYHNNFVDNLKQVELLAIGGTWHNGYPSGGNYWSDYTGVDKFRGSSQDEFGSDGIGDESYRKLDEYPFMGPLSFFYAGEWNAEDYYVVISSNFIISGFSFNPNVGPFVRFNVTDSVANLSFCRIIIPRLLLWVEEKEQWTVRVDGGKAEFLLIDETQLESTYLYLTYGPNGVRNIEVWGTHAIPEFPTVAFRLLTMVLSASVILKMVKTAKRRCSNDKFYIKE